VVQIVPDHLPHPPCAKEKRIGLVSLFARQAEMIQQA
jgi:hypothetical protein